MCKTRITILPESRSYLFLLFCLPCIRSLIVTWSPNLEWNTVSNWANDYQPKNGTRVVFPVEMRLSVGLPIQNFPLDFAGLELPRDGLLALPETGLFTISQNNASTKTAEWLVKGPLHWTDPSNWYSEKSSNAVPHLERLPCQDDVVILPGSKRTFGIHLPETPGLKIGAVRVMNDTNGNLFAWEWDDLTSDHPREFFSGTPHTVKYAGLQACLNCPCQSNSVSKDILPEICQTRGASCGELECEYPLMIEGHCCAYCGARVVLSEKTSVSLAKTVSDLTLKNYGSSLSWYARRTSDSNTEILLSGKKNYSEENIIEGIVTLTSALREQGIKITSIDTTGAKMQMTRWAVFVGPIFGMLTLVLVLLLIAIQYFGYSLPEIFSESWREIMEIVNTNENELADGIGQESSTLPGKPFRFAKFENTPDSGVELAVSSSGAALSHAAIDEDDDDDDDVGSRFANPLYRSGRRAGPPEVQTFAALQKLHDDDVDEEIDLSIE